METDKHICDLDIEPNEMICWPKETHLINPFRKKISPIFVLNWFQGWKVF